MTSLQHYCKQTISNHQRSQKGDCFRVCASRRRYALASPRKRTCSQDVWTQLPLRQGLVLLTVTLRTASTFATRVPCCSRHTPALYPNNGDVSAGFAGHTEVILAVASRFTFLKCRTSSAHGQAARQQRFRKISPVIHILLYHLLSPPQPWRHHDAYGERIRKDTVKADMRCSDDPRNCPQQGCSGARLEKQSHSTAG